MALRRGAPRPAALRRRRPGLRRLLAAGLLAAAAATALRVLAPAPEQRVPVVVAAHDLAAGQRIGAADVALARWAPGTGPDGVASSRGTVLGRVAAGPLVRGAAVTEADLLGPGLLIGQGPGLLAVPVRLADPAAAALARRGDRVDLIAATGAGAVVTDVVVLAEPSHGSTGDSGFGPGIGLGQTDAGAAELGTAGGEVVVAVSTGQAAALAQAQATGPLVLAVHPR